MASPKASGRMIRKSISESKGIASLSPEAAVLFMMLIPHFNSHGKMPGGPGLIKDEIVPFVPYFSYENLPQYLQEISEKTNVKWFRHNSRWWLHSLKFLSEHQDLREDKLGEDDLPSYITETSQDEASEESVTSTELDKNQPSRGSSKLEVRSKKGEEGGKEQSTKEEQGEKQKSSAESGTAPPGDPHTEDVEQIKKLHLEVCGYASMPPLDVIRSLLKKGVPVEKIRDIYQTHGGDPTRYRQRNVVDRLIDLRDGRTRSPPKSGKGKSKQKQEATLAAARDFVGG